MSKSTNSWQVHGRCYDPKATTEYCAGLVTILEQVSKLTMGPPIKQESRSTATDNKPFGMPIDAALAVKLIQNYYGITQPFIDEKLPAGTPKEAQKMRDTLTNVLKLTHGITFDKTIVLKILSQPNCEGLRAYFCQRTKENKKSVSLVLVGVDASGYDLNYSVMKPKVNGGDADSLVAEYAYPPDGDGGGRPLPKIDKADDPHYVLLNMAKHSLPPKIEEK